MGDFSLDTVDLGGFDAESDHLLEAGFVATRSTEQAMRGRRSIFLGRKGSGKSALFRQLPVLFAQKDESPRISVAVTPDAYAWGALQQYSETGYSAEAAHRSAWKLTLAIQIASAIVHSPTGRADETTGDHKRLARFLSENYGAGAVDFRGATRILRNLRSIKISALGTGVELSRRDDQPEALVPGLADRLFDLIESCATTVPVIVLIDRVDEEWDGSQRAQQLIVGLLMAVKEINDRFRRPAAASTVRILLFLRSDIYSAIRFDDKDKHRSGEEHLVWDRSSLRELIERRLPAGMDVDTLFADEKMPGTALTPFEYLVEHTFLRPREVLQLLFECLERAAPNAAVIPSHVVLEAEIQFSQWKLNDLKQEFARSNGEIATLLDALHQQVDRFESISEFEAALVRHPSVDVSAGTRRLVEVLFTASVIGIQTHPSLPPRFKCEDAAAVLPTNGRVHLHPALHRSLGIRQRLGDDRTELGIQTQVLDSGEAIVLATGDLDYFACEPLNLELGRALEEGRGKVLIDLSLCTFIDSAALGAMISFRSRLRDQGRALEFIAPGGPIRRLFEVTGWATGHKLHMSLAEAMAEPHVG